MQSNDVFAFEARDQPWQPDWGVPETTPWIEGLWFIRIGFLERDELTYGIENYQDYLTDEHIQKFNETDLLPYQIEHDLPPCASFTFSGKLKAGNEIKFTDTSFDSERTIVSYSWDFGDGNTSSMINPSHKYENLGSYTITLTVRSNRGLEDKHSITVDITADLTLHYLLLILAAAFISIIILFRIFTRNARACVLLH
jgi:hypothetical protein